MDIKELSVQELEERVNERRDFLAKLIGFKDFIVRHGERTTLRVEASYSYSEHVLDDFGGFDFQYRDGFTVMGGSGIRISRGGKILLDFEWWSGDSPRVLICSHEEEWRMEVEGALEAKHEIQWRRRAEKEAEEVARRRLENKTRLKRAYRERLFAEAERLKLV